MDKPKLYSRRDFLKYMILSTLGITAYKVFPQIFSNLSSRYNSNGLTPIFDVYVVQRGYAPNINLENWKILVFGEVENPLSITFNQLLSNYKLTKVVETIECVSDPDFLRANVEWSGVKLSDIIYEAGLTSNAKKVLIMGADQYISDLPLDIALNGTPYGDIIVAYLMDGQPIPRFHGFPARLVVPGWWGYKHVKWITSIIIVNDANIVGYWESLGYPDIAQIPGYQTPNIT